jgi:Membrane bound FAD containing D-sorbitol dehydrogenase
MSPDDLHRRALLQGLAALAMSGWAPAALAQAPVATLTPARFAALSKVLTGFVYEDPVLASSMLKALTEAVGAETLAKIATLAAVIAPDALGDELRIAGVDKQAQEVLVGLYSGVVTTRTGTVVLTYEQALAWQAVPWTKPNADCGGLTNYWAKAPQS